VNRKASKEAEAGNPRQGQRREGTEDASDAPPGRESAERALDHLLGDI
jgi:hypothetical protein